MNAARDMFTAIQNSFAPGTWHRLLAYSFLAFLALMLTQPYIELYRALFYTASLPLCYSLLRSVPVFYKKSGSYTVFLYGAALLFMAMLCSLLSAEENLSDSLKIVRQGLVTLIFFYAAILFFQQSHTSPQHYGNVLQIILIAGISINLWYYFHSEQYPQRITGISRVLQNPIQGSQIFTVLFLVSLYLKRHRALVLSIFAALLTAVYIYLSNSRGTIFSLFLAVLLTVLASRQIPFRSKLIGLLTAFCCTALVLHFTSLTDYLFDRNFYRLEIWAATLEQMTGFWLLGHGFGSPFETSAAGLTAAQNTQHAAIMHPHSLYVATLYHGGILSLALLSVFIGHLFKLLYRDSYGLLLLLFVLLICSTDNPYLFSSIKENWLLFWLPVGLITGHLTKNSERVYSG